MNIINTVNDFKFSSYNNLNDSLLYLDYISNTYGFKEINILPDMAYRYQGNFYGLLKELNIETSLYLFTLYINNYNSPTEFDGKTLTIKIPTNPNIPND